MDFLEWLSGLPPASVLRQSAIVYMLVNAAHILAIGLLVGAILPLDLRLAGFFSHVPVSVLAPFLSQVSATGLVLAAITGLCLFSVRPLEYIVNPALLTKLGLIAFGTLNAFLQHRGPAWREALQDGPIRLKVRLLAIVSLATWITAVIAGRWIGFL
ncbi:MAG: rane protein [Rhizobium sp.]|nr:rane protein [Rhizobium sp.]